MFGHQSQVPFLTGATMKDSAIQIQRMESAPITMVGQSISTNVAAYYKVVPHS